MAIEKNSNEFNLWKEIYMLRNKYHGMKDDDKAFKAMYDETEKLFEKYDDTDAHVPAFWACFAIREMFNEEAKEVHWDN